MLLRLQIVFEKTAPKSYRSEAPRLGLNDGIIPIVMKLERQRRRRNRTTGEMTEIDTMKTPAIRFLVCLYRDGNGNLIPVRNCDQGTILQLDGQDLFRKKEGDSGVCGYVDVTPVKTGKTLKLRCHSGQLEGTITEIHVGDWLFSDGIWRKYQPKPSSRNIHFFLYGVWKGSKKGLLRPAFLQSFFLFRPLDGIWAAQWEYRVASIFFSPRVVD